MNIQVSKSFVFCLLLLICLFDEVRPYNCVPYDSIDCFGGAKSHYFRIVAGAAPGFFTFSKLGIKGLLYHKPTVVREGNYDHLAWSLEFGLAYRNTSAILSIGPFGKIMGTTSKEQYGESDSLMLLDQYHLIY